MAGPCCWCITPPAIPGTATADAVHAAEALEEFAKLALMRRRRPAHLLTRAQVEDLLSTFG